jgi:transposase-like protein
LERYPDSIRNAVNELIRSGTTVEELEEQFGIGHGTVYKWMYQLRSKGEDVAFLKASDRLKGKALVRLAQGASVQTVFEELAVSRATVYRWRDEYEAQNPSSPSPPERDVPAAGKDEPSGTKRRKLAEAPKDLLIKQLKTALAEKTLEVDFFRGALREVEARRRSNTTSGEKPSIGGSSR